MTENNGKSLKKATPHHRITLKDVVRDYRNKMLTVKGAVFYAVSSSRKLGQPVKLYPPEFAKQLGVDQRSIYRAIASLKLENRLDFEVDTYVTLRVPINEETGIPKYIFLEELRQKCQSEGQIDHSNRQKCQPEGQIDHSNRQKCQPEGQISHKKSSEPAQGVDSRAPQSIQSLQSFSLSTGETEGERETDTEEKFRKWLRDKADSLPQKPALIEQWIESESKKPANQKEFLQYLNTLQRANIPPDIAPFQKIPPELQDAIASGDKDRAYEMVRTNLHWGLTMGDVMQLLGGSHG